MNPHARYTELVGYLVGQLIADSNPVVIGLYSLPDGRHTTRITQDETTRDPHRTAMRLACQFEPAIERTWINSSEPPWYYIQLDTVHPPSTLNSWSAPWAVYTAFEPSEPIP